MSPSNSHTFWGTGKMWRNRHSSWAFCRFGSITSVIKLLSYINNFINYYLVQSLMTTTAIWWHLGLETIIFFGLIADTNICWWTERRRKRFLPHPLYLLFRSIHHYGHCEAISSQPSTRHSIILTIGIKSANNIITNALAK